MTFFEIWFLGRLGYLPRARHFWRAMLVIAVIRLVGSLVLAPCLKRLNERLHEENAKLDKQVNEAAQPEQDVASSQGEKFLKEMARQARSSGVSVEYVHPIIDESSRTGWENRPWTSRIW